jgi:hypothetical protein
MPDTPSKTTKPPRVGRLDTIAGVVRELGKLYRAARTGIIETSDASRLASVLAVLRASLQDMAIEAQLAALEDRMQAIQAAPDMPQTANLNGSTAYDQRH